MMKQGGQYTVIIANTIGRLRSLLASGGVIMKKTATKVACAAAIITILTISTGITSATGSTTITKRYYLDTMSQFVHKMVVLEDWSHVVWYDTDENGVIDKVYAYSNGAGAIELPMSQEKEYWKSVVKSYYDPNFTFEIRFNEDWYTLETMKEEMTP